MSSTHAVLVVDDDYGTRESLRWLLKTDYHVHLAQDPLIALRMIAHEAVDVVVSDIVMGPLDGISLLCNIKKVDPDIEVILMTAFASHNTILSAMHYGASDYLIKPFDKRQVEEALRKAVAKREQIAMERQALKNLEKTLQDNFQGSVKSLMQTLRVKDMYTYCHSKRVAEIFALFAERYGFTAQDLALYKTMAFLHDIGKIGIGDSILKKEGPLSAGEYAQIKLHPKMGYHIVRHLGLCEDALDIVVHHQERYDGSGYPSGLAGARISLAARIFSVVDAYDAMRRTRPYRKGFSHPKAMEQLQENAGTQFDPAVVHDFRRMTEENAGGNGSDEKEKGIQG